MRQQTRDECSVCASRDTQTTPYGHTECRQCLSQYDPERNEWIPPRHLPEEHQYPGDSELFADDTKRPTALEVKQHREKTLAELAPSGFQTVGEQETHGSDRVLDRGEVGE